MTSTWQSRASARQPVITDTEWDHLLQHQQHLLHEPSYHTQKPHEHVERLQAVEAVHSRARDIVNAFLDCKLIHSATAVTLIGSLVNGVQLQWRSLPEGGVAACCISGDKSNTVYQCRVVQADGSMGPPYFVHERYKTVLEAFLLINHLDEYVIEVVKERQRLLPELKSTIQVAIEILYWALFL